MEPIVVGPWLWQSFLTLCPSRVENSAVKATNTWGTSTPGGWWRPSYSTRGRSLYLNKLLLGAELRGHDILAIHHPCQRDVQPPRGQQVGILRQHPLQDSLEIGQQAALGREGAQDGLPDFRCQCKEKLL